MLEKKVKNKMDGQNNTKFSKGERRKIILKILKNRRHSLVGHIIRHNEFVENILEEAISIKQSSQEDLDIDDNL